MPLIPLLTSPGGGAVTYLNEQLKYQTAPRVFIRPLHIQEAGAGTEYPFAQDLTSDDILGQPGLECIHDILVSSQRVDPLQGRAEIRVWTILLTDVGQAITRSVADPARSLQTAIAAGSAPAVIEVATAAGYPDGGHVTIDSEDFAYTTRVVGWVRDRSGNGQRGTAQGGGLQRGRSVLTGLLFDAVDDALIIDGAIGLFPTAAIAVEVEIEPRTLPGAITDISHHVDDGVSRVYLRTAADNKITFTVDRAGGSVTVTSATVLAVGQRVHLVGSYDGSNVRLYVNGVQEAVAAATGAITFPNVGRSVQLGGLTGGATGRLHAIVGQYAIYAIPPSAARVLAHWSAMVNGGDLAAEILADAPVGYWPLDDSVNAFTGLRRAARGTTAAAHAAVTLVRNGEQLRRGIRVQIFTGYDTLAGTQYLSLAKLEITGKTWDAQARVWRLTASEIQRFTRRLIFEKATEVSPVTLGPGNLITLGLRVLLSTGQGTNGPYDVLPKEDGAAVAQTLINVAALERLRDQELDPALSDMTFRFNAPMEAKDFWERQILRAINAVTVVDGDGKLSAARFGQPVFAGELHSRPFVTVIPGAA